MEGLEQNMRFIPAVWCAKKKARFRRGKQLLTSACGLRELGLVTHPLSASKIKAMFPKVFKIYRLPPPTGLRNAAFHCQF